jgi:phage baseplate assembly protein W
LEIDPTNHKSNNMLEQFNDLRLTARAFDQMTSDREYVSLLSSNRNDLDTTTGRANLVQAVINRLLTRRGELTSFGHPDYGSRLHELVGELNNLRLRALAEVYIRDCLAQESRIEKVRYVTFEPPDRGIDRDTLKVTIGISAVGEDKPFAINIPINI